MKLRTSFLTIALIYSTSVIAAPVQWGSTGHWYEFISTPAAQPEAFTLAQASTFDGMQGYLATITSAGENWFVSNDIAGGVQAWIGGSDAGDEGNWTWRNGPEAGQAFTYTSWHIGQPDNCCPEDYVETNWRGTGLWNDQWVHSGDFTVMHGYVIEYGDTPFPAIPEPETYAMLLTGLGLLGFMASRRKESIM